MSQTQTTTLTTVNEPTTVRQILQVYDIHRTGEQPYSPTSGWSEESQWREQRHGQNWASNYNRIPPYREPMRSHRLRERPAGLTTGSASFVVMMFCGVYIVSVSDAFNSHFYN